MNPLKRLGLNFASLDIGEIFKEVISKPEIKKAIIELNTINQLYDGGIDSTGTRLSNIGGSYTPSTVLIKNDARNSPKGRSFRVVTPDRVTLFDEGDFYKSFGIKVTEEAFTLFADPIKSGAQGSTNLFDRWGVNIVGLTDENLIILQDAIIPDIQKAIKERIFKGL